MCPTFVTNSIAQSIKSISCLLCETSWTELFWRRVGNKFLALNAQNWSKRSCCNGPEQINAHGMKTHVHKLQAVVILSCWNGSGWINAHGMKRYVQKLHPMVILSCFWIVGNCYYLVLHDRKWFKCRFLVIWQLCAGALRELIHLGTWIILRQFSSVSLIKESNDRALLSTRSLAIEKPQNELEKLNFPNTFTECNECVEHSGNAIYEYSYFLLL